MSEIFRGMSRLLLAGAVCSAFGTGRGAWGQDDDEPENAEAQQALFVMTANQFDMWVFGSNRNSATVRSRSVDLLELQIEGADRSCAAADRRPEGKAPIGGHGDIERFFDRVDEKREKLQDQKFDQNQINAIFQEVRPLQTVYSLGLFGKTSLYAKTLNTILNDEQTARNEKDLLERRTFQYRARADMSLAIISRSLGMSATSGAGSRL